MDKNMDAEKEAMPEFSIFYSYARPDQDLRDKLESHLALLRQQKLITGWHDRHISGGQVWSKEISEHLEGAQIILLLISDAFLSSDYCYGVEMTRALEKHKEGSAYVIPIILRHVDWHSAPFSYLQALPTKGDPVVGGSWKDVDEAFANVAKDIRKTVEKLRAGKTKEASGAGQGKDQQTQKQIIPGGAWITPQDRTVVGDSIELAALAYPTNAGDPPIQYVNFTVGWSGYWQVARTVYSQSAGDSRLFRCQVKLSDLFKEVCLPEGEIKVSFDVYDQQGNKNLAPHGTRVLVYRPDGVQAAENGLEKGLSWLEQSVRRILGKS